MRKASSQTIELYQLFHFTAKHIWSLLKFLGVVIQNLEWLPTCHDWDDFFDFSRCSFPSEKILESSIYRIRFNTSLRFRGNYCWVLLSAFTLAGFLFDSRLLLSSFLFIIFWMICSILTLDRGFLSDAYNCVRESCKITPSFTLPLEERLTVTAVIWHLFMLLMGCLCQTYLILIITIACITIHAIGRPIPPSIFKDQTIQSVEDDDSNQEEEIIFSLEQETNNNMNRFFRGSRSSLTKLVENKEIFLATHSRSYQSKKID